MNVRRRSTVIGLAAALALAACGGGDEPVADPDQPEAPAPTGAGTVPGEPVPTIAPDVPDEFLDGVGPMAAVGAPLPAFPQAGPDPAIGMLAPVLVGENLDGVPMRVDAVVDGPTWIVFLAHWCPHCNDEIPVINEMRRTGMIPDGVNVVGVSTAYNPGRPNWPPDEWLADMDWMYPAMNDGLDTANETYIAASGFGIGGFPFSVLVDVDGTVTARWSGGRTAAELQQFLIENLTLS